MTRFRAERQIVVAGSVCLALGLCVCAPADTVETTNGSVLVGTITLVADGQVHIDTDFAGPLAVPQDKVAGLGTDAARVVSLASGNVLVGPIVRQAGRATVQTALGELDITEDAIVALWSEGDDSPQVAALKKTAAAAAAKWDYEATVDIAGKTGNTERLGTAGSFTATRVGPDDKLIFSAAGERIEDEGRTTSKELQGGIDYERIFAKRHAWYARVFLEYDEFELLDLRTTAAAGYGYYFLRREDHVLRGRIGALVRHESYADGTDDQTVGIDLGLHHLLRLTEWSKLVTDVTCTPSIEDFEDYRVNHETSLEVPLGMSDLWKLRLGVSNDYNSRTTGGTEHLDSAYFARLVLGWE